MSSFGSAGAVAVQPLRESQQQRLEAGRAAQALELLDGVLATDRAIDTRSLASRDVVRFEEGASAETDFLTGSLLGAGLATVCAD